MPDDPYTKREVDILVKGVNDNFERLFKRMDNQDNALSEIKNIQNDSKLEIAMIKDTIKDYNTLKEAVSSLVNYKWWLVGAIAVFAVLGGGFIALVEGRIDTKIQVGIDQAFNSRFAKVQVINNN